MEKLIELLNEFNEEMCWHPGLLYQGFGVRKGDLNFIFNHSKFPFIKWLVENDKINLEKIKEWNYINLDASLFSQTNMVLIFLSIQDNPIEFLISILK